MVRRNYDSSCMFDFGHDEPHLTQSYHPCNEEIYETDNKRVNKAQQQTSAMAQEDLPTDAPASGTNINIKQTLLPSRRN